MMNGDAVTDRQRARFEAVRRRVFEEMFDVTSKKRLAFMLPFHTIVMVVMATHDAARMTLALYALSVFACLLALPVAERNRGGLAAVATVVSVGGLIGWIACTGGLNSPLVFSAVPWMVGMLMNPAMGRKRGFGICLVVVGFAVLTFVGPWPMPLQATSAAWKGLAFTAILMASASVVKMGFAMAVAYERIALELAVRREEIADESEGRTKALEGIAARMAHEVKNPLAAIKGLSIHVARQSEDPKIKERLTIVAAEAERLQEIVDGFLSFSRGLDELNVAATKPFEIARELSLLLETRAADAGVTFDVRGSRQLELEADGRKLRQALLNLVLNAMQASPRGSTVTLEVAKSCSDGAAVIKVMDRGGGMTREILDRIQKPYYTTKEGGTGLGIAVARGIIEQHGGTLKFESTSGRGTTTVVTLPAKPKLRDCLPMCREAAKAYEAKAKAATVQVENAIENVPVLSPKVTS